MTTLRVLLLRAAIGFCLLAGCCLLHAADQQPDPRPLAQGLPAFQAPKKPPKAGTAEEPLPPEPTGQVALRDALALALMRSPELEAFSWETRASEARALQAGISPYPEVDLRLYSLGIPRGSVEPGAGRWRVVLSQVLELGRKLHHRVNLAETERDLAVWDYEEKRVEVATVVAIRFAEVLGAQRRLEASQRFVQFCEDIEAEVQKLVEGGRMRSLEVHQVKRQVGLARIELQRAEAELATARFRLAASWGSQFPLFTAVVGDLEERVSIPDIETVIGVAQGSPAIARWKTELARSEAALAVAKSGRVPDIRLGAGMRWQDGTNERDYLVDLEIEIPLDGKRGEIREARYNMARAKAERRAAETTSSAEIAEFYYLLTESSARRDSLAEDVLPAAQAALEAIQLGFSLQAEDVGDLLDARRDLARGELQYADALVDYHQALATLEGLVGGSLAGVD